jgi:hypothetical protein
MQLTINELPSDSMGMTQSFAGIYSPSSYSANDYLRNNGRASYQSRNFPPHSYTYDEMYSTQDSVESRYGVPGVVHHVVHHVRHVRHVQPARQAHQVQQPQQFQQLEQVQRIRRIEDTPPRPLQNPVEQAFSRALLAIGDNGNRITSHHFNSYPGPPPGRKRRRINPSIFPQVAPVVREVIKIEDSDDRNAISAGPNFSILANSQASSVTSSVNPSITTEEPTAQIGQTIRDDDNVREKSTAPLVSSEQNESIVSRIDRNSLEVPGSDLIIAPEYESTIELSRIEADLQKLILGLGASNCHEIRSEYERILYKMYFRARLDAYNEVKARKLTNAAEQVVDGRVVPKGDQRR